MGVVTRKHSRGKGYLIRFSTKRQYTCPTDSKLRSLDYFLDLCFICQSHEATANDRLAWVFDVNHLFYGPQCSHHGGFLGGTYYYMAYFGRTYRYYNLFPIYIYGYCLRLTMARASRETVVMRSVTTLTIIYKYTSY